MFESEKFLPAGVVARVTETRIQDPEYAFRVAKTRVRRDRLAPAGRLNLIVADGEGDRCELLCRLLRALMSNAVDGVVGTMDVLEDLLTIEGMVKAKKGPSLLDGNLLIAHLNPQGPITGATPASCAYWYCDAVKLALTDPVECCHAITQANSLRLSTILEAAPAEVAIASGIGDSSRYLWLNVSFCEDYGLVARATTLPLLVSAESPGALAAAMASAQNVRGALVKTSALKGDPLQYATAIGRIVHGGWTVERAFDVPAEARMDRITRYLS